MDQQPKDDVDFLEPSILLDEAHYQEGYKNGYHDGLVSGKEEGRQVGLKMGFQVGEELGFFQGCLDVWMSVIRLDQYAFSARVRKNIEQLAALVSSYPLSDPENEQVQDMMEKIRLKFRVITASLGAKLAYEGRPTSSKQDVEDLAQGLPGNIIVRQRGTRFHSGNYVGQGKDHTLFCLKEGNVRFERNKLTGRKWVHVDPVAGHVLHAVYASGSTTAADMGQL